MGLPVRRRVIRVASRTRLHPPEDVSEDLAETVRIIESHELAPELAAALAPAVFQMIAARHVELEQVQIDRLGAVLGH